MTIQRPVTPVRAAATFSQIEIVDVLQSDSAEAIVDAAAVDMGTDTQGWIDCRSASLIHVTASAAGAAIAVTAQIRTTADAPPIDFALTDGELALGASAVVLDDVIKAGFIRFFVAGTAGVDNLVSLYVLLK